MGTTNLKLPRAVTTGRRLSNGSGAHLRLSIGTRAGHDTLRFCTSRLALDPKTSNPRGGDNAYRRSQFSNPKKRSIKPCRASDAKEALTAVEVSKRLSEQDQSSTCFIKWTLRVSLKNE